MGESQVTFHGATTPAKLYQPHFIVSAQLVDGKLEVVRRYPSNLMLGNGQLTPDRIVKEVYASYLHGHPAEIELVEEITGEHVREKLVPEQFIWPEPKP